MKIKIQLNYSTAETLNHRQKELFDLATLYEFEVEKASLVGLAKNIFVVLLPQDIAHANLLIQSLAGFCALKGHTWDLAYETYPSEKI